MDRQRCTRIARHALVGLSMIATVGAAGAALTEGQSATGTRFIAGGIGQDEVAALRQAADAYSLKLILAAKSGAYLADVPVRITGARGVVLDTTAPGPWLLVDLPRGSYTVQATHAGQTLERRVSIGEAGTTQLVLHFDVALDDSIPTWRPAISSDDARARPAR